MNRAVPSFFSGCVADARRSWVQPASLRGLFAVLLMLAIVLGTGRSGRASSGLGALPVAQRPFDPGVLVVEPNYLLSQRGQLVCDPVQEMSYLLGVKAASAEAHHGEFPFAYEAGMELLGAAVDGVVPH